MKNSLLGVKQFLSFVLVFILITSCASPKPYYQTREGKKKQKYYNEIQFGGKSASQMKKP